jgi:hypothetical protein
MLLDKLKEIKNWINENSFIVKESEDFSDGRVNSLLSERDILIRISENFTNVRLPSKSRSFGDFYIDIDGKYFPANLKLTSQSNGSNDNLVGMVGIMRHIFFNGKKINGHNKIATEIKEENYSNEYNDYGFLSITKETGKANVSTMLKMEGYTVNPSNGFQANFNKINTVEEKSFEDGRAFMLNKYKEYLKKKAEAFLILEGMDV